jgi:hypothetical protein
MDFAELADALRGGGVWVYLSAVLVAVCEVTTGSAFLDRRIVTELVAPVADAAGLELLDEHVYRACLRKILLERFVPLARALRNAMAEEPLEFEEGVAPSFDPIAQETVTHGFRINAGGNTVLSLSNLVRWVLVNGMRDPAGHAPLVSLDRVRHSGVPFPSVDGVFLQHILTVDAVLVPCLASLDEDSLADAHETMNELLDDWDFSSVPAKLAMRTTLLDFCAFWGVAPHPPILSMMLGWNPPVANPLVPVGNLFVVIPPVDVAQLLSEDEDEEWSEGEQDTESGDSDDDDMPVFVE